MISEPVAMFCDSVRETDRQAMQPKYRATRHWVDPLMCPSALLSVLLVLAWFPREQWQEHRGLTFYSL